MLTFENVLTVFRDYLRQDPEEEVLGRPPQQMKKP